MIEERGFIGYTYVDPQAGFSARGFMKDNIDKSNVVLRAPDCFGEWQELSQDACERLKLPSSPDWLGAYGPQNQGSLWGQWRAEPDLKEKFHPQALDDLQVIVHDGGPRLTERRPEAVWVRVHEILGPQLYKGTVINVPEQLEKVSKFDKVTFTTDPALDFPVQVRENYLEERGDWAVTPCNQCGSTTLFDAPSELIEASFPGLDVTPEALTAVCGYCGGIQALKKND